MRAHLVLVAGCWLLGCGDAPAGKPVSGGGGSGGAGAGAAGAGAAGLAGSAGAAGSAGSAGGAGSAGSAGKAGGAGGGGAAGTGGAGGAGAGGAGGAGAGGAGVVRFVALGDSGEGNEAQRQVATAIRDVCAREGCDFAVLLGDNFYTKGVTSVDDPQWQTKFEEPYRDVDLPFYAVLGNHDYGGTLAGIVDYGGLGNQFNLGVVEVMYSQRSRKWIMPATHYTFRMGPAAFIALDTNSILWANTEHGDQRAWFPTALAEVAGADWVFVLGHHTIRSNGTHGNAGMYEALEIGGVAVPIPVPILDGANVKTFFDEVVCGQAHVYLGGHDHNRQWMNDPAALCGAELIVSGAGAKLTAFKTMRNPTHFQDDQKEGFLHVTVEGRRMRGRFYDKAGQLDYEREVTRP